MQLPILSLTSWWWECQATLPHLKYLLILSHQICVFTLSWPPGNSLSFQENHREFNWWCEYICIYNICSFNTDQTTLQLESICSLWWNLEQWVSESPNWPHSLFKMTLIVMELVGLPHLSRGVSFLCDVSAAECVGMNVHERIIISGISRCSRTLLLSWFFF